VTAQFGTSPPEDRLGDCSAGQCTQGGHPNGSGPGLMQLLPPARWHFQGRARTPIDYLEFDGRAVLARCEANPKFGYQLVRRFSALMSERLQFARQKMMDEWKPLGFA